MSKILDNSYIEDLEEDVLDLDETIVDQFQQIPEEEEPEVVPEQIVE